MHKKFFILPVLALLFYGCASKGVTLRSYIQDQERLDQDVSAGNAGYLLGTPQPVSPSKPTRKVFVVEMTKETKPDLSVDSQSSATKTTSSDISVTSEASESPRENQALREPPRVTLPSFEDTEAAPSVSTSSPMDSSSSFTEYKVEKDDTLQKISKKFYNSYGKWPKIYEANKDKISNPDFLQPGIVIRIPQ